MHHNWWPISPGVEHCSYCFLLRRRVIDGGRVRWTHYSLDYGKTWKHLDRLDVPTCPMRKDDKGGKARADR